MGLWRKLVTVLAGSMFTIGGVVGVLAIVESGSTAQTGGPYTPPVTHDSFLFSVPRAETSVSTDVGAVGTWLNGTAADTANVSAQDKLDAAIALGALAEANTSIDRGNVTAGGAAGIPAPSPLQDQAPDATASYTSNGTRVFSANVSGATSSPDSRAVEITALILASAATLNLDQGIYTAGNWTASSPPPPTSPVETSADADATPTNLLALRALVSNPAPGFENLTAAARTEIQARFDSGALESDTLNQSLASQALRAENPAAADAINAELRFRQGADGSFDNGDVRATAEASRALALGGVADRQAAARALDYLDGLGSLPADQAVWRLRAHGTASMVTGAIPPPVATGATSAEGFGLGGGVVNSVGQNKVLASGIFLMGGIGLSLALVTVDALKGARRRLYDVIKGNPGLHVNELRRRLTMSPSSIEYHLSVLVGAGLVVSEEDGRYKRYYANGAGLGLNTRSPNSRNTLGALRRPHASAIVQHLMVTDNGATAREVSRALSLHESAASRRMAHLERSGVLESQRDGRERRYRVRDRPAAMKALSLVEVPPAMASIPEPATSMAAAEQRPAPEGAPAGATSSP